MSRNWQTISSPSLSDSGPDMADNICCRSAPSDGVSAKRVFPIVGFDAGAIWCFHSHQIGPFLLLAGWQLGQRWLFKHKPGLNHCMRRLDQVAFRRASPHRGDQWRATISASATFGGSRPIFTLQRPGSIHVLPRPRFPRRWSAIPLSSP